jgi:Protein of unknown function (DUF3592)
VEIIFLIAGLPLVVLGLAVIVSEAKARRDTELLKARVIGFSIGRSANPDMASYHPVAEYVAPNGQKYYIEGLVGSSVPLHQVGQAVEVFANAREPEKAVLKSGLSYIFGGILTFLGLTAVGVFWITFRFNIFSIVMAVVILSGLATKIRGAWRKEPLSIEAWQAYKKKVLATRVFTEGARDQILWADPIRVASAIDGYRKTNRYAVPVLFVLSLSLLFFSHHFYQKTRTFLDAAEYAIGTVVELRQRDSSDGDSTYAAVVEYSDRNGASFKFVDSFSSSPPYYQTGQTVNVLYNSDLPTKAQIDRGLLNYWLTALLGIPGALFLLMGIHSTRKHIRWNERNRHLQ